MVESLLLNHGKWVRLAPPLTAPQDAAIYLVICDGHVAFARCT
jgi:hypothetical protein